MVLTQGPAARDPIEVGDSLDTGQRNLASMALPPTLEPTSIHLVPEPGFEPVPIVLSGAPGVHAIVGPNNSGKSRLLRQFCRDEGVRWEFKQVLGSYTERRTHPVSALLGAMGSFEGEIQVVVERGKGLVTWSPAHGAMRAAAQDIMRALKKRDSVLLESDRLFPVDGKVGAAVVLPPPAHDVVSWYFALVKSVEERHRELAARVQAAFFELAGVRFDCFASGATVTGYILDGRVQRALSDSGEGLRDLFLIAATLLASEESDLLIDEPGLRLHPSMQRRLLRFLVENAKKRAVWLATHDGVFVGDAAIRSHVRIERAEGVSKVSVLERAEERRECLVALGWEPSDAVLSSSVLLCEGSSDQIAFREILDAAGHTGIIVEQLGGTGVIFANNDLLQQRLRLAVVAAPFLRFSTLLDNDGRPDSDWERLARKFAREGIPIRRLSFVDLELWIEAGLTFDIVADAVERASAFRGEKLSVPDRAEVETRMSDLATEKKGANRFEKLLSKYHLDFDKDDAAAFAVRIIDRTGAAWMRLCKEVEDAVSAATFPERTEAA